MQNILAKSVCSLLFQVNPYLLSGVLKLGSMIRTVVLWVELNFNIIGFLWDCVISSFFYSSMNLILCIYNHYSGVHRLHQATKGVYDTHKNATTIASG